MTHPDFDVEKHIRQEAIQEYQSKQSERMIRELVERGQRLHTDGYIDRDAFNTALEHLSMRAFDPFDEDVDVCSYWHPTAFKEFLENDVYTNPADLGDDLEIQHVGVQQHSQIPEDTVILIHPDAIAPALPPEQPWCVRNGEEIVTISTKQKVVE